MRRVLFPLLVLLLALPAAAADRGAWFRKLDRNRDGFLDRKELAGLSRHLAVFEEADGNKDGRLDLEEFLKAETLVHEAKKRAAGG